MGSNRWQAIGHENSDDGPWTASMDWQ